MDDNALVTNSLDGMGKQTCCWCCRQVRAGMWVYLSGDSWQVSLLPYCGRGFLWNCESFFNYLLFYLHSLLLKMRSCFEGRNSFFPILDMTPCWKRFSLVWGWRSQSAVSVSLKKDPRYMCSHGTNYSFVLYRWFKCWISSLLPWPRESGKTRKCAEFHNVVVHNLHE